MISELMALNAADAPAVAVALLDRSEADPRTKLPRSVWFAFTAALGLPEDLQCDWALSVLQRYPNADVTKKFLIQSRIKRLRFSADLILEAFVAGSSSSLKGRLIFSTNEIFIELSGDGYMKSVDTSEQSIEKSADNLPLQLHVGEVRLGIAELMSLSRGGQISCELPEKLRCTVHSHGTSVGDGEISFANGKILFVLKQLSALTSDKS